MADFSAETLFVNGLINRTDKVKVLGNGELKAKLAFKVDAISAKAKAAIEAAGCFYRSLCFCTDCINFES